MNTGISYQKPIGIDRLRMGAAKRPAPPEGPRPIRTAGSVRHRAHAYTCDGIIKDGNLISEYSQSNADGHGMGKR